MKAYKLPKDKFNIAIIRFAGLLFHRVDDNGDCLVKPLKCIEHIIKSIAL